MTKQIRLSRPQKEFFTKHVNSLLFNGLVETFSQVPGDYTSEQIADFVLAQEAEEMETLVKQFGYSVLSKVDFRTYKRGRRQKLSATPDLSGTVLPLCLIPNSALKSAPPFKSVVPKASA
ncbi:hypothetical protein KGZ16_17800, partial [Pseudomonas aeruginosa]